MQFVPIEVVLEMSAIFSGLMFAIIAIAAVYHYSQDIRFRRWAISMLLFWIAFLPPNIFIGFNYLGDFISSLFRIFGSILVLRAFGFSPLRKLTDLKLYTLVFVSLGLFWLAIVVFGLPNALSASISSPLMAFSFALAGHEIINFTHYRTKVWLSAGLSYLFWSISCIPMTLLVFIPEVVLFGYLMFIGQCLVLVTMYLSFLGSITRRLERNLKLTEMTGSLISHDLRNYLNVTYGALDLIKVDDPDSKEMLQTAKKTIEEASKFMKDVRSILIDISTHSVPMKDLDLTEMVTKVVVRARQEHNLNADQIRIQNHDSVIACTSPLMAQVVWNIVDNAIRYAQGSPEIDIIIRSKNKAVLEIFDTSGGLTDELKQKLLGLSKYSNDLGLGHMLIREISKVHSVVLRIEDRKDGDTVVGSIFRLEFPSAGGVPHKD